MIMSYVMPFPILLTFNFLLAVKKLQNNSTLELRFRKRSEELQLLFKRLNTQEYASKKPMVSHETTFHISIQTFN